MVQLSKINRFYLETLETAQIEAPVLKKVRRPYNLAQNYSKVRTPYNLFQSISMETGLTPASRSPGLKKVRKPYNWAQNYLKVRRHEVPRCTIILGCTKNYWYNSCTVYRMIIPVNVGRSLVSQPNIPALKAS